MRKRLILLVTCILLSMLSLTACLVAGGGNDNGNEVFTTIVRNDISIPFSSVREAVYALNGKMLSVIDDTEAKSGGEIVLGESNRAVTSEAKSALASAISGKTGGEDCGYVIYRSGDSVAVYWSDALLMDRAIEYFVSKCVNTDGLELSDGLVASECYVLAELRETDRWSALLAVAGPEITEAFQRMVEYYGDNVYLWMADLYDPDLGGFYYSNSARDHSGFLPDIESTRQALGFVTGSSGFLASYNNDLTAALPKDICDKIVAFTQSLQSPTDGYFYHPQWGENIGSTRQARDLSNAMQVLGWLKAEPLYDSAYDLIAGGGIEEVSVIRPAARLTGRLSVSSVTAVSKIVATADVIFDGQVVPQGDERFSSLENWMLWLRYMTQDMQNNNTANTISAVSKQAIKMGYGDATLDHLDSLQTAVYEKQLAADEAPTGLWSTDVNYSSISCLMKLSGIYTRMERPMQYPKEIVASMIKSIKFSPDDPEHPVEQMNHIYNTWSGLEDIPIGYQKYSDDKALAEELFDMIRADAPAMIYNTINKLNVFRKEDGSFSYYPEYSADVTNGTQVALKEQAEGDMNSTLMALDIYLLMYRALGYHEFYVPIYTSEDFEIYRERLVTAPKINKTVLTSDKPMEYDNIPYALYKQSFSSDGYTEIIEDPKDPYNSVLAYVTKPVSSGGDIIYYEVHGNDDTASCFVFETDMYLASANRELIYQINFGSKTDSKLITYMLRIRCAGGRIIVDDVSSGTSKAVVTNLNIFAPMNEWFNFRIEYYPDVDGAVKIKAYKDGNWVGESENYYDNDVANALPNRVFECVSIRAMVAADAALYLDNTIVTTSDKEYSTDDERVYNYDTWSYDFESMLTPPAFSSAYDRATVATDEDGNKYLLTEGLRTTEQQSGGNIYLPLAMTSDPTKNIRLVSYKYMILSGDANGNGIENEFVGDFNVDNHTGAVAQTSIGYNDNHFILISAEFDKTAEIAGNYRLYLDGTNDAVRGALSLELDTVYEITVETDLTDPDAPILRIYVDGTLYLESDSAGFKNVDAYAEDGAMRFGIHNMKRTICSVYIDDISLEYVE